MNNILKKLSIIGIKVAALCFVGSNPAFAQIQTQAGQWQAQLSIGQLQQDYYELDSAGQTPTGKLNTETGNLLATQLKINKDFTPIHFHSYENHWTPQLSVALTHALGNSDYDGYLQSGSQFTPYQSQTDNQIWQGDVRFGMRSGKMYDDAPLFAITPNVTLSHYRWQRELDEYQEKFAHTALLAGASVHVRPHFATYSTNSNKGGSDTPSPVLLTASAEYGRILDSHIDVDKFGLSQDIGDADIWRLGVQADYQLNERISINAGVTRQGWQYEESEVQNGYVYPESNSKQTLWQMGVGYRF
ncbi:porin family protein [Psychrobacter sp. I-STPA10]|uniref:porin family protein n=1 Tax=Psychrobacter sp. I-STPA10 TaxID=2585769 RepID=UPI001E37D42B|nr:porin family protein [Psychrobacter sp. I-STPA10]